MRIHLDIIDDNGEIIATHDADASTPSSWNAPTGQKFVSKMPQNSDNVNNGQYELFRITLQPSVRIDRPNGWTAPPPAPPQVQPLYAKQPTPWGMGAPTKQATYSPQLSPLGSMPTRG
jgi:hypothetical protein